MVEAMNIDIVKKEKSNLQNIDFSKIDFGKVYSDHMFVADFIHGSWTDLKIMPYQHLQLSPGTCVLHYGQAVFEGLKAYRGQHGKVQLFRPFDNFKRMNLSAERICMPKLPEEVFMGGLLELLKLDQGWVPEIPGTSLYIRPLMFATDQYIGLKPSETFKFVIFTCPVGPYYSEPVRVKVEQKYVRAFSGGTGFAKVAGNYASSMYPATLAHKEGYHQLIWTDGVEHKYVEESGTMNLMFLKNNILLTPSTGDTILKGITRDSVITLARDMGVEVQERRISIDEIIEGIKTGDITDAFGTGTAATIAHIESIGFHGENYMLPPVIERLFSNNLLKTLDDYRHGLIKDKFNWILKV